MKMNIKNTINIYGRTPYPMSEAKFEEVAEALAIMKQQLVLPNYMYGVMNFQLYNMRYIVNNYFSVEARVKRYFIKFARKQTWNNLNILVDSFITEYSLRNFNMENQFLNLERRFLNSEELEINKYILCGNS